MGISRPIDQEGTDARGVTRADAQRQTRDDISTSHRSFSEDETV